MDSEKHQRYQTAMVSTYYPDTCFLDYLVMPDGVEQSYGSDLLTKLHSGKVFMVNSRRRNGLILFKAYHAEFAGREPLSVAITIAIAFTYSRLGIFRLCY